MVAIQPATKLETRLAIQRSNRLGSSPSRFVFARGLGLATVIAGLLAGPGCDRKPAASPTPTPAPGAASGSGAEAAGNQSYTVRGVIDQLPDPAKPANTLRIHHEAIPGFMSGGKVVGMSEMTMPFPVGPGVSLDGLAVGDAVEFVFEVQEKPRINYWVTRITKLPAGTSLNLSQPHAKPPKPDAPAPSPAPAPSGG